MIGRLFDRLESRGKHLAVLVGLLVVTFALTTVLAYHGHRAEADVQQLAQQRLKNAAEHAADRWSFNVQFFLGEELQGIAAQLKDPLVKAPERALRVLQRDMDVNGICGSCTRGRQVVGVFSIIAGREFEALGSVPDDIPQLVRVEIERRNYSRIRPELAMGVHWLRSGERVYAAGVLTVTDEEGHALRTYGFLLSERTVREILRHAFLATHTVPALAASVPNDSIFVFAATVGGMPVVPSTTMAELSARRTVTGAIGSGLELLVGVRPDAHHMAILGSIGTPRTALLLAILLIIGVMIALALLLVLHHHDCDELSSPLY